MPGASALICFRRVNPAASLKRRAAGWAGSAPPGFRRVNPAASLKQLLRDQDRSCLRVSAG